MARSPIPRLRAAGGAVKFFLAAALLPAPLLHAGAGAAGAAEESSPATLETGALPNAKPCDAIVIAAFDWEAARLSAALLRVLLEDALDCRATLSPASPEGAVRALEERSLPLVAPGLSAPTNIAARPELRASGPLYAAGERVGFFAPSWLLDAAPRVKTLADVAAEAARFAPRPGARPTLHLCPRNWACHGESLRVARALGLDRVFRLETPASGGALLDSLDRAARARRPWIGYAWTPSTIAAEHKLRWLPPGDCAEEADAAADARADARADAGAAPCPSGFSEAPSVTLFAAEIARDAPRAAEIIGRFQASAEIVTDALSWRRINNAGFREAADYVFATYPESWRGLLNVEERLAFEARLRAGLAAAER